MITRISTITVTLLLQAVIALCSLHNGYAQTRQWGSIAEFDNTITAIEALNDTTLLVGTHQQGDINGIGKSLLIYFQNGSIVWETRLDSIPLPYFNYPHGDIKDILIVSEHQVWIAFQFGYPIQFDLEKRTFQLLPLSGVTWFSRSSDGTIIAGYRYRSTNNGTTWDTIPKEGRPESFLAIAGGNGEEFYATEGLTGLWKSIDGGITWHHKPRLLLQNPNDSLTGPGAVIVIFPNHTILLDAANSWTIEGKNVALRKSADDGESWHVVMPFNGHQLIVYDNYDNTTAVWAESKSRCTLSISSDQGDSWYEVTQEGLPDNPFPAIYAMCLHEKILFTSFHNDYKLYRLDITQSSSVDIENTFTTLSIHPNPLHGNKALITVSLPNPESVKIQLYNVLGQVVAVKDYTYIHAGISTMEIDLGIIPKGFYRLAVINVNGEAMQSTPLIVQ